MLILDVEPFPANAAENPTITITATAVRNPSIMLCLPVLPFPSCLSRPSRPY
jgi:hypothetical protein